MENQQPMYRPYVPRSSTPEYQDFKSKVISPKGFFISAISILLCVLFTETILIGSVGISVPVFALAYYCSIYYYFYEKDGRLNRSALYLTIPIAIISLSFFIHYNPSTQFISWLTLLGLICLQLVMFGSFPADGLFSLDMFVKVMVNLIGRSFMNIPMPFLSTKVMKKKETKFTKNLSLIFIGLALSLPVALILLVLFVSADAAFERAVNNLFSFIQFDVARVFADVFIGSITGILLGSALLGLKYSREQQTSVREIEGFANGVIVGTFLTMINVLLIAFVSFQFAYLFGGINSIPNMTYAEYARRGFFELCAASFLIFSISLLVIVFTKKQEGKLPLWIKLSTVFMCLCNGVLLVSAVKRMLLYIDAYGLSVKRVLTLWLMCVIGLCLIWMIVKCFVIKFNVIKWIGITTVIAVCILSLTNIERVIAKYNIDRYISNPSSIALDVSHLGMLSYTSSPEVAKLLEQDLTKAQVTKQDVLDILKGQQGSMNARNGLYGFTLDSLKARAVFEDKLD